MLEVRRLFSGYGNVPVLHDINLTVNPSEIVLVVGENGAGKSTLLRTIAGFIKPSKGQVTLDGALVAGMPPEVLVRQGLRLVLDGHRVFPGLSCLDNLRLGAVVRGAGQRASKASFGAMVDEILTVFPILRTKLHSPARDLSGGQQQMLALGQAFLARPSVLLCDEPSTGVATALLPPIMVFLRKWAESGTAVMIVEQHIDIALPVADRVVLIQRGRVQLECAAAEFYKRFAALKTAQSAASSDS
jgi:branched-chain amino acid transport system ATP-binding protein